MNCMTPRSVDAAQTIAVTIWFFGMVQALTGERQLMLTLPAGARVGTVIDVLAERYGDKLITEVRRGPKDLLTACRIAVNGRLVDSLDAPLTVFDGVATVEMILLACQEGG